MGFQRFGATNPQSSVTLVTGASLGVSTAQVLVGLPTFSLREAPLADGRARRLGQTADRKATLELTGPKENLTQAYLLVIGTATSDNRALIIRFIQNTVPGWSARNAWVGSALKNIADSPARTTVGSRVVEIERVAALGALTVTIRTTESDSATKEPSTASTSSRQPAAPTRCYNWNDLNERIAVGKMCYARCGGDGADSDAAGDCFEACLHVAYCGTDR